MKEAKKSIASKTDADNALDLGDKIEKKKRFLILIQVISLVKAILKMIKGGNFFLIFQPVY